MQPIFNTNQITLYQGDCLEIMPLLPDHSIDFILCDLPFGTTACKWDIVIPFEPLWEQYKRLIKPNGAIALFGSQPFTTDLIMSNRSWFKFLWYWKKNTATGMPFADYQPMRCIEEIIVFCKGSPTYNKQPTKHRSQDFRKTIARTRSGKSNHYKFDLSNSDPSAKEWINPVNVLSFESVPQCHRQHATQKPVDLLEYLIKTHTTEGETVLDNTCGSGSTLVAARDTGRKAIGIEKDPKYCQIAIERCSQLSIFEQAV